MSPITEVSDEWFFQKKPLWTGNISRKKTPKIWRNIFFWRTFKKEWFGVYKNKSKKYFFLIFIRKWVQLFFHQNSQNDKSIYKKNARFLTHKSRYIWNLLAKKFPMIGHMISKVNSSESLIYFFFEKKTFETAIRG